MKAIFEFTAGELNHLGKIGVLDTLAQEFPSEEMKTAPVAPEKPQMQQEPQAAPVATPVTAVPTEVPKPTPVEPVTTVPTEAVAYTQEQLALAGSQLADAGKRDQLIEVLQKYNVSALTQLTPDQYPAFATDLRSLGAKL